MKNLTVYLSDEEAEFVKEQERGFLRELIQDRILAGRQGPLGTAPLTVHLTPEQLAYVRDRERQNGPGWFGRVADINIAAREAKRPPFYWLQPDGLEDS